MFDSPAPRWFTVPAHRPFVDDLAAGLARLLPDPEALADAVVLTPTRRAARSLAEAFVGAAGGRAVLLPQIRAVGDLEEGEPPFEPGAIALALPAAIEPRRRRFELARLVYDRRELFGRPVDAAGALELADALAGFLDSCQLEEVDAADRIDGLVDGDMARHWQVSAAFLAIALRDWPRRLEDLGLIDSTARRVRLLRALGEQWRAAPPPGVLIAAGSTGTAPATADLLAVVARAPQGAVVLPGLDRELADDAWAHVGEQHPQGAMKRLLSRAGVDRKHVAPWPVPDEGPTAARGRARRRLINEALRPAEATADWLTQIEALRRESAATGVDVVAEGLEGLSLLEARTEEQAATVAALLLRETLETPDKTAALVTPDRDLARRVSAKLSRWGVEADSSAGAPLSAFPVGSLIALTAQLAVDPADPVALLGVLKHPLVRLGLDGDARFTAVQVFERRALRGARPRGWADIDRRVSPKTLERRDGETPEDSAVRVERDRAASETCAVVAAPLRAAVCRLAEALATARTAGLAARAHVTCLEALAVDDDGRLGRLWAGPEGEQAASLFAALLGEAEGLPDADARGWQGLVRALLDGETVRTGGATHARVRILGAIEARLVRADRLVLAGLEEGVWPKAPPTDPFLSRPMRERLGLPPPERRVGLSAHDFAQAACAPEVVLLHTGRRGGSPTVQSRWLWRLETLARGAGVALPRPPEPLAWAEALDAPGPFRPAPRPMPTPPVEDRPRRLSVTRVETWVRDPYSIYAGEILGLRRLDSPDAPLEAAVRGTAVHAALEQFALLHDAGPVEDGPAAFERLLNDALEAAGLTEHARARESVLSRNSGPWFAAFEAARRDGRTALIEQSGAVEVTVDGRPFRLTAKADRIELRADGGDILDFKTGQPPSRKQMAGGFAPQLTLTAAILARGGFEAAGPTEPRDLAYVRVTGRKPPAEEIVRMEAGESAAEAEKAFDKLLGWVARFDDPATPYASWTAPQFRGDHGAYDHLARVWEWAVLGAEESDEG
jgi:ATP-dependent helicase/nuclease subunit B